MSEWAPHVRAQLARLQLDGSRELEIVEELSQHLDERFEELRRDGHDEARGAAAGRRRTRGADDARRADDSAASGGARASASPGRASADPGLGDLWQDLRFGGRMLRKNPLIAATAILTIALGIGANSAIFALVDATLLRPLPFPDPEQIVLAWERTPTTSRGLASPLNMIDWAGRSRSIDRDRRLHGQCGRHGDEQCRRSGRHRVASVGDRRHLHRARRTAPGRARLPAVRRCAAPQRGGARRGLLA